MTMITAVEAARTARAARERIINGIMSSVDVASKIGQFQTMTAPIEIGSTTQQAVQVVTPMLLHEGYVCSFEKASEGYCVFKISWEHLAEEEPQCVDGVCKIAVEPSKEEVAEPETEVEAEAEAETEEIEAVEDSEVPETSTANGIDHDSEEPAHAAVIELQEAAGGSHPPSPMVLRHKHTENVYAVVPKRNRGTSTPPEPQLDDILPALETV